MRIGTVEINSQLALAPMAGVTDAAFRELCASLGAGLTVLNPGSLSFPRQEGRRPSYMLMDLDDEGEAHFTTCYL